MWHSCVAGSAWRGRVAWWMGGGGGGAKGCRGRDRWVGVCIARFGGGWRRELLSGVVSGVSSIELLNNMDVPWGRRGETSCLYCSTSLRSNALLLSTLSVRLRIPKNPRRVGEPRRRRRRRSKLV